MKVLVLGYRGKFNMTERIEESFKKLGHELVDNNPDFLIHLTGGFQDAQDIYNKCKIKPVRLYCLLDVDTDKDITWYSQVKKDLEDCEIPCVISETVKTQVKQILKIEKEINVVHFPLADEFSFLNYFKTIEFLYSGRVYAKNKNFQLVLETLDCLKVSRNSLVVCGTEKGPTETFVDSQPYDIVNKLFNSCRFLLSPSSFEGTNMNMIQSVITNTFPILNKECQVNYEFGLSEFCAEPTPQAMAKKINEIVTNEKYYYDILSELRPILLEKFKLENVVKRIICLYDAYVKKE